MAAIKYIKRTVSLDGCSVSDPSPNAFFDGEQGAHTFIIALMRGGEPLMLTNTDAVSGAFLNPNNATIALTGSIVNGAAVLTLSDDCYALSGRFTLTIDVNGATVYECQSRVRRRSSTTAYDPTGEISVAALSAEIAEMRAATAAASNVDIDMVTGTNEATITITRPDGTQKVQEIYGIGQEEYDTLKNELGEDTRNKWLFGDKEFTRYTNVTYETPLPAGTYTFSADITSEASGNDCLVMFYNVGSTEVLAMENIEKGSERHAITVTLSAPCESIFLFSGHSSSGSTGYDATYSNIQIEPGSVMTDYIPPITAVDVVARAQSANMPYHFSVSGNLASGEYLFDANHANSIRSNERIAFNADITSFSGLEIGFAFATTNYKYNRFIIDSSKLTVIDYYGNETEHQHGLTIANNIQVIIEQDFMRLCKVTIISNGVMVSIDSLPLDRRRVCFPYAQSVGSVLPNAKISWTCTDLYKPIWIFGDSYVASWTDKWVKYLYLSGYADNCLFDAFPGEGSSQSIESLQHLLTLAKPKTIVWCLGMNDGSDGATPSSDWASVQTTLRALCESNNIQLVLATIPTVPTINHEQKNANVRSSGYRYIDFAKAVGANSSGIWYGNGTENDMLSSDGVHPSDYGAKALFGRVVLDVPEIMIAP